jgi:hypothetical protein
MVGLRRLHGSPKPPANEITGHEVRSVTKKKSEACLGLMKWVFVNEDSALYGNALKDETKRSQQCLIFILVE